MTGFKSTQTGSISKKTMLSVIIPVFNEESVIRECLKRLKKELNQIEENYEIIIVNDGSTDKTLEICIEEKKEGRIRIINSWINCGHMAAITSGLEASKGEFVATMDADLQDPPFDLISMYKIISATNKKKSIRGIDVVQAFRQDRRNDSIAKRTFASLYYKMIEKVTGIKLIHNAADFRVMTRGVVNVLIQLPERNRIYRLLIPKLGFHVYPYPIIREKRFAGKTKYTYGRMLKLTVDSMLAFSVKPLRMFSYLGLLLAFSYFAAAALILILSFYISTVPGWLSLVLLLLSLNTFLFAGFGLLGEYIGLIFEHVQARPNVNWFEIK
jgi:glycosyltransferase involved in cell wall biosynthesis